MKKLFLLLLLFTNICLGQVSDTFNYNGLLTNNGWTAHSGTVIPATTTYVKQITTTTNSLNYSNICTQGNKLRIVSGNTEDINLASASSLTGTIYYSVIINVLNTTGLAPNTNTTGDYFIHLSPNSGISASPQNARLYIRRGTVINTINIGILNSNATGPTWDSSNYNINTNHLIICKYNISTNTAYLFINPILLSEGTPNITDNTGTTPSTLIKSICIRQGAASSGTGNIEIDEIRLGSTWEYVTNQTTWTGAWSNGTPNQYKRVVIDGSYNTSTANIDACSVTVNSGRTLTINNNQYVNIQNELTNNNGIVNITDGSLVQVNDSGVNTGNITYNRTAPKLPATTINGYDYIYWSSPVGDGMSPPGPIQTLSSLYNSTTGTTPPTNPGFQYQWNPTFPNTNGTYGNWEIVSSNMTPGRGYIMRASSSFGWTGTLTSKFVGIPNNGVINYTASGINSPITNYRWNLIGNPYPSSIKALKFLTDNSNIDGFVNIWTHGTAPVSTTNPYYQSFQYNYTSNDYITYNETGTSSGPTGFNGYIASGQGFFVNLLQANTPTSNIVFNNSMRSEIGIPAYSNSQFYRTSESNNEGRIWLDLLNTNNIPTRILVGYKEDATIERDRLYDAITSQNFYSMINNDKFIIQGRPDFNENDQVNLGINIPTAGEYKIAIAETDGILTTQNIYLQDLYSNMIYDITQSPYIFNSNSGTFNDRFILRYTNSTLGNNDFVINNTIIYNKDNKINIDSNKIIKNVKVYDITGKLLYDNKFNSNNVKVTLECSKQILLVKIKTDDDEIITKKISN